MPPQISAAALHDEQCYRAVQSRDSRFDGWFVVAVHTTGIYCRPSCPATTPKRYNMSFLPAAATAQQRGFRACKRCRPDASPGSPEWNARADVVARAMRLIADGVLDREGVGGVARRLGYSERHLNRLVTDELGAGPLAVARAQRAQTARVLIETTEMSMTDVAFAAGFSSVRSFNETVRQVFATSPTELRLLRRRREPRAGKRRWVEARHLGSITVRLPVRAPFDPVSVFQFLGARVVAGVESWDGQVYRRSMRLPNGAGVVALSPLDDAVSCTLWLDELADLQTAVHRCRRLLDLDADPVAIDRHLGADPLLAPLVARRPGLRSPGCVDGTELLVRAMIGQQVSVAGAATVAGRMAALVGDGRDRLPGDAGGPVQLLFPAAAALAELDPETLPMPRARGRSIVAACAAVADGKIDVDPGADRHELPLQLQRLPGIGPWTAQYVVMRALGDPDVFMPTDLGVKHALQRLGVDSSPRAATELAQRFSPWRSYALHHLWNTLSVPSNPPSNPQIESTPC